MQTLNVLPYCEASSHVFAEKKAILKKSGNMIADLDLMIASIALKNNAILVTHNIRHFKRLKKLKIENWTSSDID